MIKMIKGIMIGLMFFSIINPITAFADTYSEHDTYYLDISIDTLKEEYTFEVIEDSNKSSRSMERNTEYFWFGHFKEMGITDEVPTTKSIKDFTNYKQKDVDDKDKPKLMYSFPAGSVQGSTEDTSGYDQQRANFVGETLVDSLNTVINTIDALDNTYDINSSEEVIEASGLLNDKKSSEYLEGYDIYSISGYCDIYYGKNLDSEIASNSKQGLLYGYIVPKGRDIHDEKDLSNYKRFVWAVQKGYLNTDGSVKNELELSNLTYTELENKGDAIWITIFNVADTANYKYILLQKGELTGTNEEKNFVEELLTGIFRSFVLTLQKILSLDSIYDLVYNGGSSATDNGMMNAAWWSVMLKYHLIFQVVAWMLIGLALAKILIELNFSTINPKVRMSVMEMLQKLFSVGFLLVLAIPIMKLLSEINNDIVAIFRTQAQTDVEAFTVGNGLAQLFAYAGYFGILVSLNCVYIMRSIMIAILGATAPLFIITIAFSKGQGLFSQWSKEVIANIFLQSVHAFTLAFLFEVLDKGGTLESLVILFSLMPITDTFRSWIFQQDENFASNTGHRLGNTIGNTTKNIAKGIGGGVINSATDRFKMRHNLDTESQGGGSSRSSNNNEGALQGASSAYAARSKQLERRGETIGNRLSNTPKISTNNSFSDNAKALGSKINAVSGSSQFASAVSGLAGAGSIATGSFGTMGDMMNQANLQNYGAMEDSGKQLAGYLSNGVRSGSRTIGNALGRMGENDLGGRRSYDRIQTNAKGERNLLIPNKELTNVNSQTAISEQYIQNNINKYPELSNYAGQPLQESIDGKRSAINLSKLVRNA